MSITNTNKDHSHVSLSTMTSTVGTTELHKPNYGKLEKGSELDDDRKKYEPSGLVMLLIALIVIFLIAVILIAFAYHRYRRNRAEKHVVSPTVSKSYQAKSNGRVATETQTHPSPVKSPTPKKPARSSIKQDQSRITSDAVLLDVSQGNFVSQSDQFVPGSRDNVSWNLPFIDASRETLDNLDETEPVTKRTGAILNGHENKHANLPTTAVNTDDRVSESSLERNTIDLEKEPMLKTDDKEEDDVFDDEAQCPLPRSPSEQIDLLFRMSLSEENVDNK